MEHSSKSAGVKKPRPDFPLFPHRCGQWAKKIRGRFVYFGRWSTDPDGTVAINLWLDQKDDLLAGRKPRSKTDGLDVAELCSRFLTAKDRQLAAGEITNRTRLDYVGSTDRLVRDFGRTRAVLDLRPEDFESLRAGIAKTRGPVAVGNEIQRIRSVFRYAYESGLIDHPVRFGPMFKRPSRKTLRVAKAKQGPKLFEPTEINDLITAANPQLRAMVLLAVNCAFGPSDCATLPLDVLDLEAGWITYPRPKTGVHRRCPLWKETVNALRVVLAKRKPPKDEANANRVFVTKAGGTFHKDVNDSPISKEFAKLLKELGLTKKGRAFYALRHTFRTIGDETRDQIACDHIMGHASQHISAHYREKIGDERLRAVTDHVHAWLISAKKVEG